MMKLSDFVACLKAEFEATKFYNGSINKKEAQCVGVYVKGTAPHHLALGGVDSTSYGVLPVVLLVHWTENTNTCQIKANELYEYLLELSGIPMGDGKLIYAKLLDSSPIDVGRDENNIVEMTIRAHLYYER